MFGVLLKRCYVIKLILFPFFFFFFLQRTRYLRSFHIAIWTFRYCVIALLCMSKLYFSIIHSEGHPSVFQLCHHKHHNHHHPEHSHTWPLVTCVKILSDPCPGTKLLGQEVSVYLMGSGLHSLCPPAAGDSSCFHTPACTWHYQAF